MFLEVIWSPVVERLTGECRLSVPTDLLVGTPIVQLSKEGGRIGVGLEAGRRKTKHEMSFPVICGATQLRASKDCQATVSPHSTKEVTYMSMSKDFMCVVTSCLTDLL